MTATATTSAFRKPPEGPTLATLIESSEHLGESLSVDREKGVIAGVRVLGLQSRNGRRYLPEAIQAAVRLYEGKPVNIDHPRRDGDSRSSYDRFGVLKNVRLAGDGGLQGDLHYLKAHKLAESVCEDAERRLGAYGLSQNAKGKTAQRGGETVVEAIHSVSSVDLVADPATTRNLYEHVDQSEGNSAMELAEALAKIAEHTTTIGTLTAQNATLTEELNTLKATDAKAKHKEAITALFVEHKIPEASRPKEFVALLEGSTIENATAAVKAMAETLKGAAGKTKSVSGGAHLKESQGGASGGDARQVTDGKSFASSIR